MKMRVWAKARSRGFTMAEMLIAAGVSSVIFVLIAYIMVAGSKNISDLTSESEADKDALLAIDQVRYALLMGRFGSTEIKDDGKTLEFSDPNMQNTRSAFTFKDGALWYDPDTSSGEDFEKRVDRLVDVTFSSRNFGAIIRVDVTARGRKGSARQKLSRSTTEILLRN